MRRPETWQDPPPLNGKALKWGLAAGTIALPAMIVAALLTNNKDLFSATAISLIAYCLAWLVLMADGLAARLENHPGEEIHGPAAATARSGQPAA